MSLNIKSPEADALVAELAHITGESKTRAVVESLRERLEREKARREQESTAADLLKIGEKCASYSGDSTRHDELLFDDDGLPL